MNAKPYLIALPLVAGASWAGATAFGSAQTRGAYEQLVEQLDAGTLLAVTNTAYTKGFTESTAETTFYATGDETGKPLFVLRHVISHSPIQLKSGADTVAASHIETTLDASDLNIESEALARALGSVEGPLMILQSSVGFNGDTANALHISGMDYADEELTASVAASNYTLNFGANGELSGEGGLGGGTMDFATGERLVMSPTRDAFDFERIDEGLYVGMLQASLASLELASPELPQAISMQDVSLDASSSIESDIYRSSANLQVGTLDSPLDAVTSAEVAMSMDGVSVSGVQAFQAGMRKLQQMDPETAQTDVVMELLSDAYLSLLQPGANLTISSGIDNDGGTIKSSVAADFVGDGSTSGRDDIITVGDLLRTLKLALNASADADAIALTPAAGVIGTLEQRRFVVREGDRLKSDISLADLVADINGEPLSLELMLGDLMAQPIGALMQMVR